jgi:hypothetical protein
MRQAGGDMVLAGIDFLVMKTKAGAQANIDIQQCK